MPGTYVLSRPCPRHSSTYVEMLTFTLLDPDTDPVPDVTTPCSNPQQYASPQSTGLAEGASVVSTAMPAVGSMDALQAAWQEQRGSSLHWTSIEKAVRWQALFLTKLYEVAVSAAYD